MTDDEARLYKLRYDNEVRRLLMLPPTHHDRQPAKGGRKASKEDLEYLAWLEEQRKRPQPSEDDLPDFGASLRKNR